MDPPLEWLMLQAKLFPSVQIKFWTHSFFIPLKSGSLRGTQILSGLQKKYEGLNQGFTIWKELLEVYLV
jgi:hypothetical protein